MVIYRNPQAEFLADRESLLRLAAMGLQSYHIQEAGRPFHIQPVSGHLADLSSPYPANGGPLSQISFHVTQPSVFRLKGGRAACAAMHHSALSDGQPRSLRTTCGINWR